MKICLFFLLLLCACVPSITNSSTVNQAPATEAERLLERRDREGRNVWADGNTLTFVYEGKAESVEICCGFQESLTRLPDSNVWTLSKTIENLSKAVVGYFFVPDGEFPQADFEVWRGSEAPPEPETLEPSPGRIFERTIKSEILGEDRLVFVYLPPDYEALKLLGLPVVYLADGASWDFANYVEPLIRRGELPPFIMIGILPGDYLGDPNEEYNRSLDLRAQEYVPSVNYERFKLHERFLLEEVLPWSEENFGASNNRDERIVGGFSNGGVFAAAMGLKNPNVFGYALPFSPGDNPVVETDISNVNTKFYLTVGELDEKRFVDATKNLADTLSQNNITNVFEARVAGHDNVMWREEFVKAMLWVFEN